MKSRNPLPILLIALLSLSPLSSPRAQIDPFNTWLQQVVDDALNEGISPQTVQQALGQVTLDEEVIELDQKQPETTITFRTYAHNILSPERLQKGRALMATHKQLLRKVAAKYGVPPSVIVALWGVESSFGNNCGGFNVINSLVTLAYEGRRASLFRGELMHALHLLDEEHMDSSQLTGSWAGAMGQSQFMPSTFRHYAVDFDGDGHRDIWNSEDDVFASIARYLAAEGWKTNMTWGREVKLSRAIPANKIGLNTQYTLATWSKMGVRNLHRKPLPAKALKASLIQPDGPHGRSFLVYDNFRVFMRWNRSTYFATSVGLLADQLAAR